ncbi:hypothetical protein [Bradyrhizobium japonicum]|uniref:hypothetical protein n=1 Tax=Bradyrhizobium japonicum TaxID=375 RepID=UPI00200FE13B|nr:hypothetical protein [Bradyrhizobium japonicum]UQD96142.1 hypothetical protein JEY30_31880 [Bradyrhizobium japonicum]
MQTNDQSQSMQDTHTAPGDHGVEWVKIAEAFYHSTKSVRAIAAEHGISETAIRKHAKQNGWRRPSAVARPMERRVSVLADAIEAQLVSIDSVIERSRRFVAAMIQLGAEPREIAAALSVSERALMVEFRGEFSRHSGLSGSAVA